MTRPKSRWESNMEEMGLHLIEKLDGLKVLVGDGTFEYVTYTSSLSSGTYPTIACCTDKTKLFLHKNKDNLNKGLDYSEFEYKGCSEKSTVICGIHGRVSITAKALAIGAGCYLCGRVNTGLRNRYSHEDNLKKARKVHGDKYEYFDLNKSNREFVEIKCPEHGVFKQKLTSHLQGCGCKDCAKLTFTHEENLKEARAVHGDRYQYGNLRVPRNGHVEVICPEHGVFMQRLSNHLRGKGCKECGRLNQAGFNRSSFKKYSTYYLYLMKATSKSGESFYKIGISVRPKLRARQMENASGLEYSFEIIYLHKSDGVSCFNLELALHKKFWDMRYTPKVSFSGSTECFSSVCLDSVKKIAQCCA